MLRTWLLGPNNSTRLDVVLRDGNGGSSVATVVVEGTMGLHLIGQPAGQQVGMRMFAERDAIDKNDFWRIWRLYNRDAEFKWADEPDSRC